MDGWMDGWMDGSIQSDHVGYDGSCLVLGARPSMAQRPSPVAARVSPSAELHPEIRSMQRPPADLWSRTYDRQPTTTTSLRSMAQRTQQSLPRSGPASPASPASPARQKPRSSKR